MIHQIKENVFIIATFIATKGRFKTTYTKDKLPIEASSLEDLTTATPYNSRESARRAIRKNRISVQPITRR